MKKTGNGVVGMLAIMITAGVVIMGIPAVGLQDDPRALLGGLAAVFAVALRFF